ncbi:Ger(x)C family spore germination protein [Alkalicella caledoniensis]|uniref:Ger(X)C family spore germination protein n=1 Tax=Alkalicella caledoniensis TaxID=2731377 RepID=A0A7G9W755_ALKCA|nr:Ger(x)C family spore germination protein [Alkalicella caledoniensis]QNO14517.1 Ger(x)C family spore germination protein [Alkalicella caledoniensis]
MKKTKIKKQVSLFLIGLCLITFVSGCWGKIEVEDLGIIVAMGIDANDTGDGFEMTLHIIKPQETEASDGQQEGKMWVASAEGQTLIDAAKNFRGRAPAQLTWMHNNLVFIGEETARDNIADIMDFLTRNRQIRYKSWVLITQGKAKEVMQATPEFQPAFSEEILGLIENSDEWSKQVNSNIRDMMISMVNPYKDFVTARVLLLDPDIMGAQNEEQDEMSQATVQKSAILDGAAVVKGTELAGWLTKTETRSFLFLEGEASEAVIIVPYKDGSISVEIGGVDTEMLSSINDEQLVVNVDISGEGSIVETNTDFDFIDPKQITELEAILSKRVVGEIRNLIEKIQGEYKADILGISGLYERDHPKWWNNNKDKWIEDLYPEVVFDIRVNINLFSSGMITTPVIEKGQR